MSPTAPSPEPSSEPSSLATRCVRALLDRHGLPRYRQSPWLADALGLSYSQAHRRMTGASPWTLEDIEKVGTLLGESLAQVVSLDLAPASVPGVLAVGSTSLNCRLWLGDPVHDPAPHVLVATKTLAGWSVHLAGQTTGGADAYSIEKLEATPGQQQAKAIAVLDDDRDLTLSICAHLEGSGYEARPFYDIADLLFAARSRRYDGFVIDWIVGETSTMNLIAALRAEDASCPIVVLTAQVSAGVVSEDDIAEAVRQHHIDFSEKPLRLSILSATLGRAFAKSEAA